MSIYARQPREKLADKEQRSRNTPLFFREKTKKKIIAIFDFKTFLQIFDSEQKEKDANKRLFFFQL